MTNSTAGPATVIQVVHNLDVGGLERVVISLIDGLDATRYRSVLVCLQDGGALLGDIRASNLRVYGLRKGDRFSLRALGLMTAILRRERADIVHCHNRGALTYGVLASLLAGRGRVMYTAHGVRSAGSLRSIMLGWGRRRVRRVVAVSEDARRVATARGRMDPRRTMLVINGIDVRRFDPAPGAGDVRRALGIEDAAFVFGIVARLTPVKDHGTLLRAFARVQAAGHRGARLVIVGGGESTDEVRSQVDELGLSGRVVMTGDRRDVPALMGAMDAFVLSSYSEGLSITLLEAMAASLPVVATRVGGNAEIVQDGVSGLLVEPRNAEALAAGMIFVLERPGEARRMGVAGRARVEAEFSERAMVDRYAGVYDELLAGPDS